MMIDGDICSTSKTRLFGSYLALDVSDNGSGIAPEHLPRLFDRSSLCLSAVLSPSHALSRACSLTHTRCLSLTPGASEAARCGCARVAREHVFIRQTACCGVRPRHCGGHAGVQARAAAPAAAVQGGHMNRDSMCVYLTEREREKVPSLELLFLAHLPTLFSISKIPIFVNTCHY